MRIEELKKGQPYNVRLLFQEIDCDNDCVFIDPVGLSKIYLSLSNAANRVTPISTPSEPPTLVGPAPKYDPCRKFRKGDKVRLIKWNGRNPFDAHHGLKLNPGEVHIVLDDEYDRNEVYIGMSAADEEQSVVHSCNLELVTPIEELEPYTVDECGFAPTLYVRKNGKVYMTIPYKEGTSLFQSREEALAAAEAERDRLNAEYRKELGK